MSPHDDAIPAAATAADDGGQLLPQRAVDEAGQLDLVDGGVALLRLWLVETTHEYQRDFPLMQKLSRDVVAAAAVKYRLSPKRTDDLAAAVAAVLDQMAGELGPAAQEEV